MPAWALTTSTVGSTALARRDDSDGSLGLVAAKAMKQRRAATSQTSSSVWAADSADQRPLAAAC
jgi:hypothetical protein